MDSVQWEGYWRTYRLHVPASYNSSTAVPLVINIHGLGSNSQDQMTYTRFNSIADTANFIVIYPDGLNNAWNAGFLSPYNSGPDDVGLINFLIDTIAAQYNINQNRVYSIGISNGAFMSYRLACELKNRIAAIGPVAGTMTYNCRKYCQTACGVPIVEIHGTKDGTVPYGGSAQVFYGVDNTVQYWANRNGCGSTPTVTNLPDINTSDSSTVIKYEYTGCSDTNEVTLYKVIGGGHTWPGPIPVPSLGVTNMDIDGSIEIWNFLRKHRLRCATTGIEDNEMKGKWKINPNPAHEFITIKAPARGPHNYVIYNECGQIVMDATFNGKQETVKVSSLPQGLYLVRLDTEYVTKLMITQ